MSVTTARTVPCVSLASECPECGESPHVICCHRGRELDPVSRRREDYGAPLQTLLPLGVGRPQAGAFATWHADPNRNDLPRNLGHVHLVDHFGADHVRALVVYYRRLYCVSAAPWHVEELVGVLGLLRPLGIASYTMRANRV